MHKKFTETETEEQRKVRLLSLRKGGRRLTNAECRLRLKCKKAGGKCA